jgi:hypothetical protein
VWRGRAAGRWSAWMVLSSLATVLCTVAA